MAHLITSYGKLGKLPLVVSSYGQWSIEAPLPGGIHRLRAVLDGQHFAWDRLWLDMVYFKNKGQRTGPWDFDFNQARPLGPAWWVQINGEKLGLVTCGRPTTGEIHQKRLSLQFAFEVEQPGTTHIILTPYRPDQVEPLYVELGPAVEDMVSPLDDVSCGYARHQAAERVWVGWKRRMDAASPAWASALNASVARAKAKPDVEYLPLLAFAMLACDDIEAGDCLVQTVRRVLDQAHWGNPHEDGYGHNGDMGAASILESLSFVYHWADAALQKAGLRDELRNRMDRQMRLFFRQMLLWDEFWGGSLLQDHGYRSIGRFGVAAANTLEDVPASRRYLQFVMQRMRRTLEAMPNDGAIPFSSYHVIQLYADDLVPYRDMLLSLGQEDIFDRPVFGQIIRFIVNRLDETTGEMLVACSRSDRKGLHSGWAFFNAMAERHGDVHAARLSQILLERYRREAPTPRAAATLVHALAHINDVPAGPLKPEPFDYRPDSGMVHYRARGSNAHVSLRCHGAPAMSSWVRTTCRCDRLKDAHLEGHFAVSVGGQTLLMTAEGGYRQHSYLGAVLLVDGQGPWGDTGAPMSQVGITPRGEHIEMATFDASSSTGYVRMRLDPAFARESGLIRYYRQFVLRGDGMTVRDTVLANEPHCYTWHFHTYARRTITRLSDNTYEVRDGNAALSLAAHALEVPLRSTLGDTDVVWAYGNEHQDQDFRHVRFDTVEASSTLAVEFIVTW